MSFSIPVSSRRDIFICLSIILRTNLVSWLIPRMLVLGRADSTLHPEVAPTCVCSYEVKGGFEYGMVSIVMAITFFESLPFVLPLVQYEPQMVNRCSVFRNIMRK